MRRGILISFVLLIVAVGCSSSITEEEYYQKGLDFLHKGNRGGAIVAFKKAIEIDPGYFEAHYELARAYLGKKKYDASEREARKVLHLNPSFSKARIVLGKALLRNHKYDSAISEIKEFLVEAGSDSEAEEILALAFFGKKEFTRAEELLKGVLRREPDRISAMNSLAEQFLALNRNDAAFDYINEALKVSPDNKKALLMLADLNMKKQDVEGGIDAYKRILKISPNDINASFQLGFAYLLEKDVSSAKMIAGKLITRYPRRAEGRYLTGICLFYEKNYDDAVVLLQAVANSASIPGANYYLGIIHFLNKRLEQAASEFQKVVDMMPDMQQARLLLAVTHLRKGRADKAAREAKEVISRDENNAFAHSLLGSAYLASGDAEKASKEFDHAIEINPALVNAYMKKGVMDITSGNSTAAEQELITAVEVAPGSVDARILLAQFYLKNGKFENAIKVLNDGIGRGSDDVILYDVMGAAYAGASDMNNAELYFKKAISSNERFFLPHLNLARIYLRSGDRNRASQEYKKVLEIDAENIPAMLMLARIMEDEKRDKEAIEYYESAVSMKRVEAFMAFAGYYLRKSDPDKAIEVINEGLKLNKQNLNLIDFKGNIYLKRGEFDNALSAFREMAGVAPSAGAVRVAEIYAAQGDYDRAIFILEDIAEKENKNYGLFKKLYDYALRAGKRESAERYATKITSIIPDDALGYVLLAELYFSDGKFKAVSEMIDKVLLSHPGDLRAETLKGRLLLKEKRYNEALSHFRDLKKAYPRYAPVYFMEASVLEKTGNIEEAVKLHHKALTISSGYVPALNNLAYLYAQGYGPLDIAEEMASKARKIAPEDGSIADTLGWIYYKKGEYDKAIKQLRYAYEKMPMNPGINLHMGLAYLKKGDKIDSRKYLEAVLSIGEVGSEEAKKAESILKGLN